MQFVPASYGFRASGALLRAFPTWRAPESAPVSDTQSIAAPSTRSSAINLVEEPFEFYMSCQWLLDPDALGDYFTALRGTLKKTELIFDPILGGFKIRCLPRDHDKVVAQAMTELDRILIDELKKGPDGHPRISQIGYWRLGGGFTPEELEEYKRFTYPHEIAHCKHQGTWHRPESLAANGLSAKDLLPADVLSCLQQATATTLFISCDGSTVYIGAKSDSGLSAAKRKLDNLSALFSLPMESEPQFQCFLFDKGGSKINNKLVLQYLSHVDNHILKTYYLDRTCYRSLNRSYRLLFEKGVVVSRLATDREKHGFLAAVGKEEATQQYEAFSTDAWKYRAKQDYGNQGDDSPPLTESLSLNDFGIGADKFHTDQNPLVETWVSHLPDFKPQRLKSVLSSMEEMDNLRKLGTESDNNRRRSPLAMNRMLAQDDNRTILACEGSGTSSPESVPGHLSTSTEKYRSSPQASSCHGTLIDFVSTEEQVSSEEMLATTRDYDLISPTVEDKMSTGTRNSNKEMETGLDVLLADLLDVSSSTTSTRSERISAGTNVEKSELRNEKAHNTPKTSGSINNRMKWAENDPFANVWQGARSVDVSGGILGTPYPQLLTDDEMASRSYHNTMHQQAGSRKGTPKNPQSELMLAINEKLVTMMRPLELMPGLLSFKVDLGRFCFTKINPMHVQLPDSEIQPRHHELHGLQESLNRRHITPQDVLFTKIITTHGGDANFIANLKGTNGQEKWCLYSRRTIYEVTCTITSEDSTIFSFVIDIDGTTFEQNIRQTDQNSWSLGVHVMKHSWDFQISLASSINLDNHFETFAKDLVHSTRILPQSRGPPVLEFTNKDAYQVKICHVRTRNIASYNLQDHNEDILSPSSGLDRNILEISEVWDMRESIVSQTEEASIIKFEKSPGNQRAGEADMWYEVSIRSSLISTALAENRNLEFGDKCHWSAEEFQKSGAFDSLISTATEMVESIDGIGYWGDNFQDTLIHGVPPSSIGEIEARKRGIPPKPPKAEAPLRNWKREYW
ncbi:hypothetical protein F4810DRAFT_708807 [Camillea tinctor]|nr:hypothetical protein F4810DRAFT_708807 [Camillea tinctor]